MALNLTDLHDRIFDLITDPPPVPFLPDGITVDYDAGRLACGQAWANAMREYAAAIVPASITVTLAGDALATALATAFASPAAAPGMETAFAAFAAAVGAGMGPAFVATPPPDPVNFAAQFAVATAVNAAATSPAEYYSHAAAATATAGIIDVWMKKGTATPFGGGPPVNWT